MEIKVFCHSCSVEILRADTDTLKSPLVGSMFLVKKDMEWDLFSPHDFGNDLICPMCEWAFHENGKLKVAVGNEFIIGVPELIIPGILASYGEAPVEAPKKSVPDVDEFISTVLLAQGADCYQDKEGKNLEGDLLNSAIHIVGTFHREFWKLDKAAEVADDKMATQAINALKREFELLIKILGKLPPVDAGKLADCLDWSLKGRLGEYFPAWNIARKPDSTVVTPNPALKSLQEQVEGDKTEETTEIAPEMAGIQAIVEEKPEKEGDAKPGAWAETQDADEESEMNGDPPPGAKIAESGIEKKPKKKSRKIKKRAKKVKIKK